MKKINCLIIIVLAVFFVKCADKKIEENTLFTINSTAFKDKFVSTDVLSVAVLNPENKEIDSISYFVNEKKIQTLKGNMPLKLPLKTYRLGYQYLSTVVYFEGENAKANERIELVSDITPKLLKYTIVATHPHDSNYFTEGLEFYKDTIYESSGLDGVSFLVKYDYKTGKVYKKIDLEPQYFAEGITILNGKLFQLTWKNKTGLIYDAQNFKLEKKFTYDKDIEGWGMTNDGKYIYHTDKTEKIWKMDSNNQKMLDYVNVYSKENKIQSINELEWIENKIYANIWMKDAIAVINPVSGAVESIIDFSNLRKSLKSPKAEVLNGIAYNLKTKTIFITGKYWDKTFEVKVF